MRQKNRSGCPTNDDQNVGRPPGLPISDYRIVHEVFSASIMIERPREGMDADVPVDAENAPTATWKTEDSFPRAPTPIIYSWRKKEERRTKSDRQKQRNPTVHQIGSAPLSALGSSETWPQG